MPSSHAAIRSALTALSFVLPLTFVALASAQSACGDGPACPENWECKTEPVPCLALPCDREGGDCEPVDCAEQEYSYCSPLPCTSDSQCGDGMVCYSETHEECDSAPPCADGDCPVPADSECTPVTESGCVPRYVLPCEADADCGVGFTCEAEEECSCAGSSGSGSSGGSAGGSGAEPAPDQKAAPDGGAADPAPPADGSDATPDAGTPEAPDCVCQKTDRKSCNVKIVACSVDEGCPPDWTCGDNPNGSCWASSDGSSGCDADPAKICLPPYSDVVGGGRGVAEDGSDTTTGGLGETPEPPKGSDDGSGSGNPADASGPSADDDSGGSDGCAIGHPRGGWHQAIGLAALALAGLYGARRRRSR